MDAPQSSVSLHVSSCNPLYFVVRALHGGNVLLQDLLDSDGFFTHAMLHTGLCQKQPGSRHLREAKPNKKYTKYGVGCLHLFSVTNIL